jgi:hypothetical protein
MEEVKKVGMVVVSGALGSVAFFAPTYILARVTFEMFGQMFQPGTYIGAFLTSAKIGALAGALLGMVYGK